MTDNVIKTDHELNAFCQETAQDIFDAVMAEPLAEVEEGNVVDVDPNDWREDMYDATHEAADGCEHVIYYYRAIQICANCNTDRGDEFLEDTGMPEEITFEKLATIIAYGEIKGRIDEAIDELIENFDPDQEPETHTFCFETLQHFTIEAPAGTDPEALLTDPETIAHFAELVKTGQIEFKIESIQDEEGNQV